MRKVIDADYEVISGPLRVGDEHPTRKGWYLTDQVGADGNALWFKPPGPFSRWIRRIAIFIWIAAVVLGVGSALLFDKG